MLTINGIVCWNAGNSFEVICRGYTGNNFIRRIIVGKPEQCPGPTKKGILKHKYMAFWDNILQNDLFWANIHTMLKGQKSDPEMFRKFSIFQDLRSSKGNNWIKVYLNSNTRGLLSSKPAAAHYYWQNLTMVDQKYYPNRHIILFHMIILLLFHIIPDDQYVSVHFDCNGNSTAVHSMFPKIYQK